MRGGLEWELAGLGLNSAMTVVDRSSPNSARLSVDLLLPVVRGLRLDETVAVKVCFPMEFAVENLNQTNVSGMLA